MVRSRTPTCSSIHFDLVLPQQSIQEYEEKDKKSSTCQIKSRNHRS